MVYYSMIIKEEKATWLPHWNNKDHGWLAINGKIWQIIHWHSFSDFGQTLETLTIERGNQVDTSKRERKEIYSYNEGETFTYDCE